MCVCRTTLAIHSVLGALAKVVVGVAADQVFLRVVVHGHAGAVLQVVQTWGTEGIVGNGVSRRHHRELHVAVTKATSDFLRRVRENKLHLPIFRKPVICTDEEEESLTGFGYKHFPFFGTRMVKFRRYL